MTAKARLHAQIDRMSDAEVERLLSIASFRIGPLTTPIDELPVDEDEMSAEDRALLDRSYAEVEAGAPTISIDELRGELG
jgi:hypothetical protein